MATVSQLGCARLSAFLLYGVLTPAECRHVIAQGQQQGFQDILVKESIRNCPITPLLSSNICILCKMCLCCKSELQEIVSPQEWIWEDMASRHTRNIRCAWFLMMNNSGYVVMLPWMCIVPFWIGARKLESDFTVSQSGDVSSSFGG